MYINKPELSEELYKFFIKGMPLKPISTHYHHLFKRKGWNTYAFITGKDSEDIRLDFYTVINSYHPDWILKTFKYVDTKTN